MRFPSIAFLKLNRPKGDASQDKRVSAVNVLPILLLIPVIAYAVLTHGIISDRFDAQEMGERARDVHTCVAAIETRKQLLQRLEWTSSASFHRDAKTGLPVVQLPPATDSIVDGCLLLDSTGRKILSRGLSESVVTALARSKALTHDGSTKPVSGLIAAGHEVYVASAGPLGKNVLILADHLDASDMLLIGKTCDCAPSVFASNGHLAARAPGAFSAGGRSVDRSQVMKSLSIQGAVVTVSDDGRYSFATERLADCDGAYVAVLATTTSRSTVLQSHRISAIQTLIFVAISILLGLLGVLQIRSRMLLRSAMIDEVTGLYNHRFMQERLEIELARCQRYGRPMAVAMIDIDHFKDINDEFGHQVGDEGLKHLSRMLQQIVRSTDVVARYGGEEFLVIMTETDLDAALNVAERIRAEVQASSFEARSQKVGTQGSGGIVKFTVSVGVAGFPVHAEEPGDLIMAADLALFAAKRASRNAVMSYDVIIGQSAGKPQSPKSIHLSMREGSLSTIRALAAAIDARDHRMRGHSEKVALCSLAIGDAMGLSTDEMNRLRTAGLLHDVGRIAIPDAVLAKPGKLTEEERALVATHSEVGAAILSKAPQLGSAAEVVLRHHEHYDGTGYPGGLAGEEIPLLARIVAVADAFDALTSDRAHRSGSTAANAVKTMQKSAGKQFDPNVLAALEGQVSSGRLFDIFASFQEELRVAA